MIMKLRYLQGELMKRTAFFAAFLLLIVVSSCRQPPEPMPDPVQTSQQPTELDTAESVTESALDSQIIDESALADDGFTAMTVDELNRENILDDIYFEFDKSRLTPETRAKLKAHAEWLMEHPTVKIIIEGHCDERGTSQYNMALGDRRAFSVKNYFVSLGIEVDRMHTISYGENVPKVEGSSEWAWSQNRRAHFVIQSK